MSSGRSNPSYTWRSAGAGHRGSCRERWNNGSAEVCVVAALFCSSWMVVKLPAVMIKNEEEDNDDDEINSYAGG